MAGASAPSGIVVNLEIEPDGALEYEFSYDPPKRMNEVFDQQSYYRFDHYAAAFAARRAHAFMLP